MKILNAALLVSDAVILGYDLLQIASFVLLGHKASQRALNFAGSAYALWFGFASHRAAFLISAS